MKTKAVLLTVLLSIALCSCAQEKKEKDHKAGEEIQKPNIIYILADDMGIGDLCSYGQTIIQSVEAAKLALKRIKKIDRKIFFTKTVAPCFL